MKVIFLDVDGVLNHAGCTERAYSGVLGICTEHLEHLRSIVQQTGAKIVLTSTWKEYWEKTEAEITDKDGHYLDEKIKESGLEILDKTEDWILNRGEGIRIWMEKTEKQETIESWVVLDDEIFPDYERYEILLHLVKTNFGGNEAGLQEKHVREAVRLLNGMQESRKEV